MPQEPQERTTAPAPSDEVAGGRVEATPNGAAVETDVAGCTVCGEPAVRACERCAAALCADHSYHEAGGALFYCRSCADAIVGVCDVCDALHARPCRECGLKVCEAHQKRVIERWGWGGAPGQGGVLSWFPVIRTYCQEHGRNRVDVPKPSLRTFTGYDGSSPEW